MIDYLQEFEGFIAKKGLTAKKREIVLARGKDILSKVMEKHREVAE